jgi:hypothetical protein
MGRPGKTGQATRSLAVDRPVFFLNRSFDVPSEEKQITHQALDRKARQLSLLQRGDLRLVYAERGRRFALRHSSPLYLRDNLRGQLGLC